MLNKLSFTESFFLPFLLRNLENKIKLWEAKCTVILDKFQPLTLSRFKTCLELLSSVTTWNYFFLLANLYGFHFK